MEVVLTAMEKIIPYIRNPRKNDAGIEKVASSIKEFGWQQPIVVDKEMVIVVGHTRYMAAKKLGLEEAPVSIAESLNPQQIKAYRIADNKTAEFSEWDNDQLVLEIEELQTENYDVFLTGFNASELDDINTESSIFDDLEKDGIGFEDSLQGEGSLKTIGFTFVTEEYNETMAPFIKKHGKEMLSDFLMDRCKEGV